MKLALYLLCINALTYFFYWLDKRAAVRGGWRIPESTLLSLGFIGGTPAAIFAQQRLRHKNRKPSFQAKFWILTLIQIALLIIQPGAMPQILARLM